MPHAPRATLLRAALETAARGWPVFPLRPGSKQPAGHAEARCPGTGRCTSGHLTPEQRATLDPELIHRAWTYAPYNIGLATGPAELVVIDLDVPKDRKDAPDGAANLRALCERADQPHPHTYTVRTPSGGQHLYYQAPHGARMRSTKGTLAPLIDTRAWGGYILAAGSHLPGGAYRTTHTAPITPLPGWLRQALTPTTPAPKASAPIGSCRRPERVAAVALTRERDKISAAPEGTRERTLFEAARAMGRFIAWGDIDRHQVEEAFQEAGQLAGLTAHECRSTLRSALNWSIRTARPRGAAS